MAGASLMTSAPKSPPGAQGPFELLFDIRTPEQINCQKSASSHTANIQYGLITLPAKI
jgi:hypothetical protein